MYSKHFFTIVLICSVFSGIFWFVNSSTPSSASEEIKVLGIENQDVINNFPEYDSVRFFLPENEYIKYPSQTNSNPDPSISAKGFLAYEPESGYVFIASGTEEVLPLASITKLMTALVFLDFNLDWDTIYTVQREDHISGGRVNIYLGDKVTLNDLFNLALVASDNTAANCLVSATGLDEREFVSRMNKKAWELGIANAKFSDPIGLSYDNVATLKDVAYLFSKAIQNDKINQAIQTEVFNFTTYQGSKRRVINTNFLLNNSQSDIISRGGKTGYNEAANYCFVGNFEYHKKNLITVVLGDVDTYARIENALELAKWSFDNFTW